MTELSISPDQIASVLKARLEGYAPTVTGEQVGRILEIFDGIARVSGLPQVGVNELLEFENGSLGLALNLDEDTIGAVVLGTYETIEYLLSGANPTPGPSIDTCGSPRTGRYLNLAER